jgi:hypothetical protein
VARDETPGARPGTAICCSPTSRATRTTTTSRPGRYGTGASSHCAHGADGDALREDLGWRPFSYFTNRVTPIPNDSELTPPAIETTEFVSLEGGGTPIRWRVRAALNVQRTEPPDRWLSHAPGTIRTCDLCLRRAALYPLSYGRVGREV